jgi:hypothetical protein
MSPLVPAAPNRERLGHPASVSADLTVAQSALASQISTARADNATAVSDAQTEAATSLSFARTVAGITLNDAIADAQDDMADFVNSANNSKVNLVSTRNTLQVDRSFDLLDAVVMGFREQQLLVGEDASLLLQKYDVLVNSAQVRSSRDVAWLKEHDSELVGTFTAAMRHPTISATSDIISAASLLAAAVAAAGATGGAATPASYVLIVMAANRADAGLRTAMTGEIQRTGVSQALDLVTGNPHLSEAILAGAELGTSLGAARLAALRAAASEASIVTTVAPRGGTEFFVRNGTATPIPLHNLKTPWWKYLSPKYDGKIWVRTQGRTPQAIGRTWSHELKHVDDFINHSQITHLAARQQYFPGSGMARYVLEFRGYRAGGQLDNLLVPLRSFKPHHTQWLGYDVIIFGVGGGTATGMTIYDLLDGDDE